MLQQVKALDANPFRRELTPESCPVTYTCTSTHTQINLFMFILKYFVWLSQKP